MVSGQVRRVSGGKTAVVDAAPATCAEEQPETSIVTVFPDAMERPRFHEVFECLRVPDATP